VEGHERARPLLSTALKEFEALQPWGPTLEQLQFRSLSGLGVLLDTQSPVASEGLFRNALDQVEHSLSCGGASQRALTSGRGPLWHAQVLFGYATHLEGSRRAEQRASEIVSLRQRARSLAELGEEAVSVSPQQLRWSLAWLPEPRLLTPADLIFSE